MACKYVKEFEHPSSFGYSGSAGKTQVNPYMRGGKVEKVMREYKEGTLHSGGSGKVVTNPKQAVAIAMSESRKYKK